MILKTGMDKESEKRLITGFLVQWDQIDSQINDVIINIIKTFK